MDYPKDWIGRQKGRDALVIGSGPSAKDFPFDEVPKNVVMFGGNAVGRLITPHWYFITDPRGWEWYREYALKCVRGEGPIPYRCSRLVVSRAVSGKHRVGVPKIVLTYTSQQYLGEFSPGCPVWHGRTVGMVMLNIAYQMGFSRIFMIGIDGYRREGEKYFYDNPHVNEPVHTPDDRDVLVRAVLASLMSAMKKEGRELINLSTISAWDDIVPVGRVSSAWNQGEKT